ncbi:thioredoxin domain-containing protein [Chloroflexota bacterium]
MPNRLINETSPYLLQHAHNPVDWYPWGEEALGRAEREDRPVLLSIGYSACHWCHVMERECFEDEDIAGIMNEDFVNIKVDREERPDLDAVYMDAVQAMTGGGGWPLTVFLTPQGKPFFGGTYFPPEDRLGLPGLPTVLRTVAEAYRTRGGEVETAAEQLVAHLKRATEPQRIMEPLTAGMLSTAYQGLQSPFDRQNGGFGSAPKFPQPMVLEYLLRYHRRTGDPDALLMVGHSLERMAGGGIYDQIGGGFHRYSVDARWLVPHFEKMLYDNALLGRVYLHAYQATGKRLYSRIVEETLDYILREMTDKDGGFCSSQDADSGGAEGIYYTWTPDEVSQVVGRDAADLVCGYFGITEEGNLEGRNVLTRPAEIEALASGLGCTPQEMGARLKDAQARLLERRARRVPPHRDGKILAGWNGLMLACLAEAASVLDREDYLEAAVSNATFLTRVLYDGQILKHSYKDGRTGDDGFLQDYAFLCEGLLCLYQATFDGRWLEGALNLANALVIRFWDEEKGCFYDSARDRQGLIVRPRAVYDNALPSGSAAASFILMYMARLTENRDYEGMAAAAVRSVAQAMARAPIGFGHWLCALDFYLSQPVEVVLIGRPREPATKSLIKAIQRRYLPDKVLVGRDPERPHTAVDTPLFQGKSMLESRPTAYVCIGRVCNAPVTDPGALERQLDMQL